MKVLQTLTKVVVTADKGCVHPQVVSALPHDAHFMGILMAEISALSTCHPEQNPALAGQNIYQNKEIMDKQICRLIGERSIAQIQLGARQVLTCSATTRYRHPAVASGEHQKAVTCTVLITASLGLP